MRVGVTQIRFIGEGSFFRASSGIFLKAAWVLYSSEKGSTIAGDLQASEIAKTIILVVNGKADVTVLFQSDELSPAFREHPELAVMLHLTGIWITFPVTEFVVCIIAVVFVRKDRSCHESWLWMKQGRK